MDPLVAAVESLPIGSCAPSVVSQIYAMPNLSPEGKRALAVIFMASYRMMVDPSHTSRLS